MKILVSNIDRITDEDDLWQLFEEFGELISVELNEEPDPGKDTFSAIIEMDSEEEATLAKQELEGERIDGRLLKIRPSAELIEIEEHNPPILEEEYEEDIYSSSKGGLEKIERRHRRERD